VFDDQYNKVHTFPVLVTTGMTHLKIMKYSVYYISKSKEKDWKAIVLLKKFFSKTRRVVAMWVDQENDGVRE
jgi:hypothetical protein